jgi:DNA repair exonuclease SbcCD nuclease subunit
MKFMQLGDAHVGYRQYGIKEREKDFSAAFSDACRLALKEKVDAVLVTGDIFENNNPTPAMSNFVRDTFRELRDAGIEVVGIEGNHDSAAGEILSAIEVPDLSAGAVDIKGCKIYGIPYVRADLLPGLLHEVPEDTDILLMHQTLAEVADIFGDISADEIVSACPSVSYVALGHIHDARTIARCTAEGLDVYLVYNGSTEMNDIDESWEKSIPIVEWSKGESKITLHPVKARKIEKIILETDDDVAKLHKELPDKENCLLYLIAKNTLTRQVASVLESADTHGILYMMKTVTDVSQLDVSKIQAWERSKSAIDLKKIIQESFEGIDRERALLMQLLDTPENMKEITQGYIDELKEDHEGSEDHQGTLLDGEGQTGEIPA